MSTDDSLLDVLSSLDQYASLFQLSDSSDSEEQSISREEILKQLTDLDEVNAQPL